MADPLVSVGGSILASDYNTLQGRIANILGTGSGEDGYGQTLVSSQVDEPTTTGAGDGDIVEAQFMQNLFDDMNKAYTHQTGSDLSTILYRVSGQSGVGTGDGDVIGADKTGTGLTYSVDRTSWTFDDENTQGGFNDYLVAMTTIETNKFDIFIGTPSQGEILTQTTDVRTTQWGSPGDLSIDMEFTATFDDADHRRYFFNSGGEIRITGSLAIPSGETGTTKNSDWSLMLSNVGAVKFNYDTTTADSGTTYAIGNNDLTGTYQTILEKSGSGFYAENLYKVEARQDSATVLRFKVTLQDADTGDVKPGVPPGAPPGPVIDEYVTGTITLALGHLRASGSNVDVDAPSIALTANILE